MHHPRLLVKILFHVSPERIFSIYVSRSANFEQLVEQNNKNGYLHTRSAIDDRGRVLSRATDHVATILRCIPRVTCPDHWFFRLPPNKKVMSIEIRMFHGILLFFIIISIFIFCSIVSLNYYEIKGLISKEIH